MRATILAGYSFRNAMLFHRTRFLVGDASVVIELDKDGRRDSTLIIRDIEAARARLAVRVDRVISPADILTSLSPDRETQFAEAAAAFLKAQCATSVTGDRTLPLSFTDAIRRAGITVDYDPDLGIASRRRKTTEELDRLREAQAATESAMRLACEMVARAQADARGILHAGGALLTAERVKHAITLHLLERGYDNPPSIVAGGESGGDCHDHGHGDLKTGEPVIIDIFPRSRTHLYCGDSTRVVVHGTPRPELVKMHAAVLEAKAASTAACRPGIPAGTVNTASEAILRAHGYTRGIPTADTPATHISIQHGTGHGIGLEGHEPPLIDGRESTGPELVVGDVITIEPGLYSRAFGGVRVEDMVAVTQTGAINLGGDLHEGLNWT